MDHRRCRRPRTRRGRTRRRPPPPRHRTGRRASAFRIAHYRRQAWLNR
jgi:hypothetical protein